MLKQALWDDAKRIFDAALAIEPARRDAYLREACGGVPELLEEVQSLLSWHGESVDFLEEPVAYVSNLPILIDPDPLVGQSLGVWRIVDVIGHGGMGVVYRAERADDAFTRQAALKVVRRGGANLENIVGRFRRERETLAALDHPNIARLLDGGSTPDGEPYFVMEYVDGERVDSYCDARQLSIRDRLLLFRTICQAVDYAHQNLVVHRDLKPDNILVSRDGAPKLLDFGIATLVSDRPDSLAEERTASATWLMTPDFASPEQMAGRVVTTAADVYSLGVLLHVLLTGERPYRLTGSTPDSLQHELSSTPFTPPSARVAAETPESRERAAARAITPSGLSKCLSGDLDAIVARAVSREIDTRYRTVGQLLDDLERHRSHQPVAARPRDMGYLSWKFMRRHAVAVAVTTAIALLVFTGVGGVVWQAAIASEAQGRAERRFNDLRRLANAFMFEVHDEIVNLPGTTRARELMVRTASDYLQSLAREATGDFGLQRELASAFVKLGDAQGHPTSANIGDTGAARASYQEAIRIAGAILAADPADVATQRTLAMAHRKHADVLAWTGEMASALSQCQMSREMFFKVASHAGATPEDRLQAAVAEIKLGDLLGNPHFPNLARSSEALSHYEAALVSLRTDDGGKSGDQRLRRYLGIVFERIGTMHETAQRWDAAESAYRESFGIRQALAADAAPHTDIQRDLAVAYEKLGNVQFFSGDFAAAAESYRGALAQFRRLEQADPSNATAVRSVAISREHLANTLMRMERQTEAVSEFSAALETHEALASRDDANVPAKCDVARLREIIGDASRSPAEACAFWSKSLRDRRSLTGSAHACAAPAELERLSRKLQRCPEAGTR